jgi:leader peptidase (prepilin peptidase)/N-methyltransferase
MMSSWGQGFRVFVSATAIAGLLNLYVVQALKYYNNYFLTRRFALDNLRWIERFRGLRWFLGSSTIRFMKTRTMMFPAVEVTFGSIVLLDFLLKGERLVFLHDMAFISLAVPLALISWRDRIEDRIAPDYLTIPGIVLGILLSPLADFQPLSWSTSLSPFFLRFTESLLGAAVCASFAYGSGALYLRWRGVEGMGLGAVKACAMVGAFFGLRGGIFAIFVGSVLGSFQGLVGVGRVYLNGGDVGAYYREYPMSFVLDVVLAGVLYMLVGRPLLQWYLTLWH